jgi:formylglycine-generating enzyme required for sulfatase activity
MKVRYLLPTLITQALSIVALSLCGLQSAQALNGKNFQGIPFILIQPGCFTMGNTKSPTERTTNEFPSHRVCIEKAFYLSETEVTQKQWEDIMGNNPSKVASYNRPVDRVNWNDVQAFITTINKKDGGTLFRLPTEAEWEYAAKAGSNEDYSFGNDASSLDNYAWFGNLGYKGSSHEVALKQPNAWGLYDMHGNVWEWVQDWYDPEYYKNSPEKNPAGAVAGKYRVYRGGSWVGKPDTLRSSQRSSALPVTKSNDIGFRLLREAN